MDSVPSLKHGKSSEMPHRSAIIPSGSRITAIHEAQLPRDPLRASSCPNVPISASAGQFRWKTWAATMTATLSAWLLLMSGPTWCAFPSRFRRESFSSTLPCKADGSNVSSHETIAPWRQPTSAGLRLDIALSGWYRGLLHHLCSTHHLRSTHRHARFRPAGGRSCAPSGAAGDSNDRNRRQGSRGGGAPLWPAPQSRCPRPHLREFRVQSRVQRFGWLLDSLLSTGGAFRSCVMDQQ